MRAIYQPAILHKHAQLSGCHDERSGVLYLTARSKCEKANCSHDNYDPLSLREEGRVSNILC